MSNFKSVMRCMRLSESSKGEIRIAEKISYLINNNRYAKRNTISANNAITVSRDPSSRSKETYNVREIRVPKYQLIDPVGEVVYESYDEIDFINESSTIIIEGTREDI